MNYYPEYPIERKEEWIEVIYQRDSHVKNNRAIYGDEVYLYENEVVGIKREIMRRL